MRDTRICAHPGDTEHDHEMCRDVMIEQAARYASHWHVALHSDDDDRLSTYDFVEALDYAAAEVDRLADSEYESIHAFGEDEMYEDAWHAFERFNVLQSHALSLRNMVNQATDDTALRAPHYRDEPTCGPLWTIAAERAAGEANLEIGRGFAFFYRCVCGDCRPGAWIIRQDKAEHPTTYSAAEFFCASAAYREIALDWAEQSDSDAGGGSDLATVASMLADPASNSTTGHAMRIYANDGSTVTFSLEFDPESVPTEL